MAIKITGTFTPSGEFSLIEDIHLLGGFRVVDTEGDRDNIPALRRKWGMLVYVRDSETTYILKNNNGDLADNANWEIYNAGGSAAASVDDITIESTTGYKEFSKTENTIYDLIKNNWFDQIPNGTFSGAIVSDGVLQNTPLADNYWSYEDDPATMLAWEAGTYEFYAPINVGDNNVFLYDSVNDNAYFFTVTQELGLYRYSVTLPAGAQITYMGPDNPPEKPFPIRFINRYSTENASEITIKNINWIIGADGSSIDGMWTDSVNPKEELPTLEYVQKRAITNADEITLEKVVNTPTIADYETDYQTVFHNQWDQTLPTSGWTLGSNTTYANGTFTVNYDSGQIGSGDIIYRSDDTAVFNKATKVVIVTDISLSANGLSIAIGDSNVHGVETSTYDETPLQNGTFLYSIYIPEDFVFSGMAIYGGGGLGGGFTGTVNISIVEMASYPPKDLFKIKNINYIIDDDNESIDGSNTPATDPHSELVTRAYIDSALANLPTYVNGLYLDNDTNEVKLGGDLIENTAINLYNTSVSQSYQITFRGENGTEWLLDPKYLKVAADDGTYAHTYWINGPTVKWELTQAGQTVNYQVLFDRENKEISTDLPKLSIINNEDYSITQVYLENNNATSIYSGASFVVTSSSTAYQDNTYLSHYGSNFYVPQYRNTGSLFSDRDLYIGSPYNDTNSLYFVIGTSFDNPTVKAELTTDTLTTADEVGFVYGNSKTPRTTVDVLAHRQLYVNKNSGYVFRPEKFDIKFNTRHIQITGWQRWSVAGQHLQLYHYIWREPAFVKVYKNGTELTYGTDWNFTIYPEMPASTSLNYTTSIELASGYDGNSDVVDIYIIEPELHSYPQLYLSRGREDNAERDVRNSLITKKLIEPDSSVKYLKSVTKNAEGDYTCVYEDANTLFNPPQRTIVKKFFNNLVVMDTFNGQLDYYVEFWAQRNHKNFNYTVNFQGKSKRYMSGHLIPRYDTDKNNIPILSLSQLNRDGLYYIRLRYVDDNGVPFWTPFYPMALSVKTFHIFTTDRTFSNDTYVGDYKTLRFV